MIKHLTEEHLQQVATIHKKYLPGILSFYSKNFIAEFYKFQTKNTSNFLLGEVNEGKVLGFVFGSYEVDKIFDEFITENKFFFFFQTILAIITHPQYLIYIFSKFLKKEYVSPCKTQLVYIAVDKVNKQKGTGQKLLDAFEQELESDYYELEVEKNNPAYKFYEKNHFTVVKSIDNLLEKKYLLGKKSKTTHF